MNEPSGLNAQRLMRALKGERLQPPPIWIMRQAGRYLPEYRKVRESVSGFLELCYTPEKATEVTLQPIRRYGFDAAIIFSDILVVPHALGQKVAFEEGVGPVLDPISTEAQVAVLSAAAVPERLAPVYEAVRMTRAALSAETTLIGFAGAPWTVMSYMIGGRGSADQGAAKMMALCAPELFAQLESLMIDATADHLLAQAEAGADALQLFDTWAIGVAAHQFDARVIAPTREIVRRVRARRPDIPIIGFPRGAAAQLERYLRETGVDAVGLDQTTPAGWARRALGANICLQGNLDPLLVIRGGAPMRDAARAVMRDLESGPYIFNLGHGVTPPTPPEHVAELVEFVRQGG